MGMTRVDPREKNTKYSGQFSDIDLCNAARSMLSGFLQDSQSP